MPCWLDSRFLSGRLTKVLLVTSGDTGRGIFSSFGPEGVQTLARSKPAASRMVRDPERGSASPETETLFDHRISPKALRPVLVAKDVITGLRHSSTAKF